MKKKLSIIALLIIIAILTYGIIVHYPVESLNPSTVETESYSAYKMTEAITYDGLINQNGKLYDTTSLLPATMSVKDCKT